MSLSLSHCVLSSVLLSFSACLSVVSVSLPPMSLSLSHIGGAGALFGPGGAGGTGGFGASSADQMAGGIGGAGALFGPGGAGGTGGFGASSADQMAGGIGGPARSARTPAVSTEAIAEARAGPAGPRADRLRHDRRAHQRYRRKRSPKLEPDQQARAPTDSGTTPAQRNIQPKRINRETRDRNRARAPAQRNIQPKRINRETRDRDSVGAPAQRNIQPKRINRETRGRARPELFRPSRPNIGADDEPVVTAQAGRDGHAPSCSDRPGQTSALMTSQWSPPRRGGTGTPRSTHQHPVPPLRPRPRIGHLVPEAGNAPCVRRTSTPCHRYDLDLGSGTWCPKPGTRHAFDARSHSSCQ